MSDTGLLWAIEPGAAEQLRRNVLSIEDMDAHRADMDANGLTIADHSARITGFKAGEEPEEAGNRPYQVDASGIVTLSITGVMTKRPISIGRSCSTLLARRLVQMCADDPAVKSLFLVIDSPGGEVAGTGDLAQEVARFSRGKKSAAYIEDCGCSAAYWAASQCRRVYCNPTAMVGSIGTLMVVQDSSEQARNQGITVWPIQTGKWKAVGVEGSMLTARQRNYLQGRIDAMGRLFFNAVRQGRRLSRRRMRVIQDAGVFVGMEAKLAGLVDGICSREEAISNLNELTIEGGGDMGMSVRERLAGLLGALVMESEAPGKPETNEDEYLENESGESEEEGDEEMNAKLSMILKRQGVMNEEDFRGLVERAVAGDRLIALARADAKREAIRAYGAENGMKIGAQAEVLPLAMVETMRDAWRAEADAIYGLSGASTGRRVSAAPGMQESEDASPRSSWDRLTADQKEFALGKFNLDSASKREQFAENLLSAAE